MLEQVSMQAKANRFIFICHGRIGRSEQNGEAAEKSRVRLNHIFAPKGDPSRVAAK
jgi:hypothetical protein